MVHGCTHTRHGDIRNEVMALLLARTRYGQVPQRCYQPYLYRVYIEKLRLHDGILLSVRLRCTAPRQERVQILLRKHTD